MTRQNSRQNWEEKDEKKQNTATNRVNLRIFCNCGYILCALHTKSHYIVIYHKRACVRVYAFELLKRWNLSTTNSYYYINSETEEESMTIQTSAWISISFDFWMSFNICLFRFFFLSIVRFWRNWFTDYKFRIYSIFWRA